MLSQHNINIYLHNKHGNYFLHFSAKSQLTSKKVDRDPCATACNSSM